MHKLLIVPPSQWPNVWYLLFTETNISIAYNKMVRVNSFRKEKKLHIYNTLIINDKKNVNVLDRFIWKVSLINHSLKPTERMKSLTKKCPHKLSKVKYLSFCEGSSRQTRTRHHHNHLKITIGINWCFAYFKKSNQQTTCYELRQQHFNYQWHKTTSLPINVTRCHWINAPPQLIQMQTPKQPLLPFDVAASSPFELRSLGGTSNSSSESSRGCKPFPRAFAVELLDVLEVMIKISEKITQKGKEYTYINWPSAFQRHYWQMLLK